MQIYRLSVVLSGRQQASCCTGVTACTAAPPASRQAACVFVAWPKSALHAGCIAEGGAGGPMFASDSPTTASEAQGSLFGADSAQFNHDHFA